MNLDYPTWALPAEVYEADPARWWRGVRRLAITASALYGLAMAWQWAEYLMGQ